MFDCTSLVEKPDNTIIEYRIKQEYNNSPTHTYDIHNSWTSIDNCIYISRML